ncbi:MAG: adenylyl-sulfate kinase [Desulfovibrio sp.]|nr:adenylyl-sulfate kinase [Desulfovibrio sp.]
MMPVIWLLGLSGSGKTTLGSLLRLHLESQGHNVAHVDGDAFRRQFGFTGFTPADRIRNIDAMREHALQLHAQGKVCIVTAITPYECMRRKNREQIPLYREIWVRCALKTLVDRDTKGLYARAARGELERLTGVADAFDEPLRADAIIDTDRLTLAESYVALRDVAEDALNVSRSWREFREDLRSPVLPLPPASVHCLKQ